MENDEIDKIVVIDFGSSTTKAGFAGCDFPTSIIPTIIGKNMEESERFVGKEVFDSKNSNKIKKVIHPIERGLPIKGNHYEDLLHHLFYTQLQVYPEELPVLYSEGSVNLRANREKLIQISFETFNTPAIYVAHQENLALFATGKIHGKFH